MRGIHCSLSLTITPKSSGHLLVLLTWKWLKFLSNEEVRSVTSNGRSLNAYPQLLTNPGHYSPGGVVVLLRLPQKGRQPAVLGACSKAVQPSFQNSSLNTSQFLGVYMRMTPNYFYLWGKFSVRQLQLLVNNSNVLILLKSVYAFSESSNGPCILEGAIRAPESVLVLIKLKLLVMIRNALLIQNYT